MNPAMILLDMFLMVCGTVVLLVILSWLSQRLLGINVGVSRVFLAGIIGLGAGVGFESQFVWRANEYTPAMIPILLGIIILVAIAVLVVAELVVPKGSLPRADQWLKLARQANDRNRRYAQLVRIFTKHRLFAIKLGSAAHAETTAQRTRQAASLRQAIEEAGGAFVKLGQLLSTRPDVLPAEYIEALDSLQQKVPPVAWPEIEEVLKARLKSDPLEAFASFATEPFAAASIGQVHAATLHSGERVAVKVRRPGIVETVERDIDIALRLARRLSRSNEWAANFGIEQLVSSLAVSLRDELDYALESSNMLALAEIQEQLPASARVRIPGFYADYSCDEILVMEYLQGNTLSSSKALESIANVTRQELARRLLSSTLAQIMEAGVFHSDLHPGNIIIDDKQQLALLDFGFIGRIDSVTRTHLGEVLFAYSRKDAEAFVTALFAFVELDDVQDEKSLRRAIAGFMSRRLGPGSTVDASMFGEVVGILAEFGLAVPSELTVPFRTIATVEGSLQLLDPNFDFLAEAEGYAKQRLTEMMRPSSVAKAFTDELLAALPLAKRLPHRIDQISGNLAEGRFGMNIRMFSDTRDRGFVREIIGLAVVTFLAGIFGIMAAMLLTSESGPRITETLTLFQIFGYLFLVVAGVLTLRALFDVLRRRPGR